MLMGSSESPLSRQAPSVLGPCRLSQLLGAWLFFPAFTELSWGKLSISGAFAEIRRSYTGLKPSSTPSNQHSFVTHRGRPEPLISTAFAPSRHSCLASAELLLAIPTKVYRPDQVAGAVRVLKLSIHSRLLFDKVMEIIPVNLVYGPDLLPGHRGEGDLGRELLSLFLNLPERHDVSVRRVEDDLDGVHLLRALNMEEEPVIEVHQGVSSQQAEASPPQLLGDGLGYRHATPFPARRFTAARLSPEEVLVYICVVSTEAWPRITAMVNASTPAFLSLFPK